MYLAHVVESDLLAAVVEHVSALLHERRAEDESQKREVVRGSRTGSH